MALSFVYLLLFLSAYNQRWVAPLLGFWVFPVMDWGDRILIVWDQISYLVWNSFVDTAVAFAFARNLYNLKFW